MSLNLIFINVIDNFAESKSMFMVLYKLLFLLLLSVLSQFAGAQQHDEYEEEKIDFEQVVRDIYNNHSIHIEKEINRSVNVVYDTNQLLYLMGTYRYDDSITVANNDKLLIENLDKSITKQDINKSVYYKIGTYNDNKQNLLYEHPVIDGLIKHHEALKEPISRNGAISQAVHLTSENFLDLRKSVTTHIIGFFIFGIIFHFAFRMIIKLKTEKTRNKKKSMFILIEIMAYVIIIVILSQLIDNKCREFRINTTRLLSVSYNEALAYSYEYNEEDLKEDTDTTEVGKTNDLKIFPR